MLTYRRWFMMTAGLALVLGLPQPAAAQADPFHFKFNSGQNVQPVFEGWSRNPDGSFNMHFGYLNRNYVEELHVPIGPDNNVQPGGPDRGQPTYFYTRVNRNLFRVTVPSDWGRTDQVVWTVTANGKTERAVGWLQAEWEIDPVGGASGGGRTSPERAKNQPPTIAVDTVSATVAAGAALTFNAAVMDDGLPKPRPSGAPRATGQETPPTLKAPEGTPEAPVNVPQVQPARQGDRPQGLAVSWIVWRGPAGVAFDPANVAVKEGQATTTATFSQPGTYLLRARANDSMYSVTQDITVTVTGQ